MSGGADSAVKVWDTETRQVLVSFSKHSNGITSVDIAPDGKTVASAGGDNILRVFDATNGNEIATFNQSDITRILFLRDGRELLSASRDKTIKRWEIGRANETTSYVNDFAVMNMALAPDGSTFASSAKGESDRSENRGWYTRFRTANWGWCCPFSRILGGWKDRRRNGAGT